MQISASNPSAQSVETPLPQILLDTANLFWSLSAPPTSKDHLASPTGELMNIALTMPFFARHREAFVCPRIICAQGNVSPREFLQDALAIPADRAQKLADWILQDLFDWSEGFNGRHRRGSLFKEQEIKKATLVLARMGEEGLGLVSDNGHPCVKPQKDFYAFVSNRRYTEEIGPMMSGIELPDRIKERFLPMIEASALREVVNAARSKVAEESEVPSVVGIPGLAEADAAFAGRQPKRL